MPKQKLNATIFTQMHLTYMKYIALLLMTLLSSNSLKACFILCMSDGEHTIVGNHEDWFASDAAVRIIPPSGDRFGSVIFTFENEGWAQGGMNERGLFFDATYTPFQEVVFENKVLFEGYLWQKLLDDCTSVESALQVLKKYEIPELEETHIFLADSSGNAAVIGVQNGQMVIKRINNKEYLMQTNFNPWHPELSDEPYCWRYDVAEKHLKESDEPSEQNVLEILKRTHQDSLTIYSNIYDLRSKTVTTYYRTNFEESVKIDLAEIFKYGNCMMSLPDLIENENNWEKCNNKRPDVFVRGTIVNSETMEPVPFANIGILNKNIGTLSDPDGTFQLSIPDSLRYEELRFSSIGYKKFEVAILDMKSNIVKLKPEVIMLDDVIVRPKSNLKTRRSGWVKGDEGVVPFDTVKGGGAVALLLETEANQIFPTQVQLRLLYNSKDTVKFRLHFYEYDTSTGKPGKELLTKEILLKDHKRFGWMKFDLRSHNIVINHSSFFIGFEWLDERESREEFIKGIKKWELWKKKEYEKGNSKIELIATPEGQSMFKYHGNMMNWPGFDDLPPWTGLMVEKGKNEKTTSMLTFERKTSFGSWKELNSTLNAVLVYKY